MPSSQRRLRTTARDLGDDARVSRDDGPLGQVAVRADERRLLRALAGLIRGGPRLCFVSAV